MIISDQHRFAFVHIPKCAGTSVRKALRPIDETVGMFDHIAEHPEMGTINFGHITLPDLATFFPDQFAKVTNFRSVAIVRDPVDRFFSGLFQRLREFKGYNQSQISKAVVTREALVLADHLRASAGQRLDLEFVHFNRQSDYVFHNDVRVVETVFALDRLADASRHIEAITGVRIAVGARENRTSELRFGRLKPLARMLRAPYGALIPQKVRERVRSRLERIGVYGDVETRGLVTAGSEIDGFLRDHYRRDFALFAAATAA